MSRSVDSQKQYAAAARLRVLMSASRNKSSSRGSQGPSATLSSFTFKLFFPKKPYNGAEFATSKGKEGAYNFVGLVLGHQGSTVKRLQRLSGARVEIHGRNSSSSRVYQEQELHAFVQANSKDDLEIAVRLLLEVLQPTNTTLRPVTVVPGRSATLQPVPAPGWAGHTQGGLTRCADACTGQTSGNTHGVDKAQDQPSPTSVLPQAPLGQQAWQLEAQLPNAWAARLKAKQEQQECRPGGPAQQEGQVQPPASPFCTTQGQSVLSCWLPSSPGSCATQPSHGDSSTASSLAWPSSAGSAARSWSSSAPHPSPSSSSPSQESGDPPPRQWSLWEPGGSPSFFDGLHSVVQEQQQCQEGGLSPLHASQRLPLPEPQECCYFKEAAPAASQGLRQGELLRLSSLPLPSKSSWVQQLALGPGAGSIVISQPAENSRREEELVLRSALM